MRRFYILALSLLVLSGCGFPAPYQTYAPSEAPPPPPPVAPLIVYGATTTMPDMTPDSPIIAPVPVAPPPTTAPPSNQVAICYNRLWNKPDTIRTAAAQACGGAPSPQITSQGFDIEACPLLTPTKAVFACSAKTP
ncbi:MAG TPA: hypothetical protein VHX19_14415 [Stellaceae bacterium]|nr:hypothetical protein [Stellaceae bacterium]